MGRLVDGILLEHLDKPEAASLQGVIVLPRVFPQISYQFHRVMEPLAEERRYFPHLHKTDNTTNSWLHNQGSCDRPPTKEAQADPRSHPRTFTE